MSDNVLDLLVLTFFLHHILSLDRVMFSRSRFAEGSKERGLGFSRVRFEDDSSEGEVAARMISDFCTAHVS